MPRYVGLVVHGIGEQEKGSTLKQVGAALADLIRRSRLDPEAELHVSPAQDEGPAWADIVVHRRAEVHTIHLGEVWWARSLQPPSVQRALGFWAGTWFRDPLGLVTGTFRAGRHWRDIIFLQRLIAEAVTYAALPFALPLAAVLWFLGVNPFARFLPKAVSATYGSLTNVLTRHIGDVSVYLDDSWEAARIQEVFGPHLEAIMGQEADERFIIAHSLGAVVTYEGLLRAARTARKPVPVHFIAVGAALNRAHRLVPREEAHRLRGPLAGWVRLTYVHARHDPVTLGRLDPRVKWAVSQPQCREVVNQEDIFSDHTTYWNNAEEVMAPILRTITGGRLTISLRERYRRLRVTVLAFFKGLAWMLPAAVFFWTASTDWSEAFAAWAYGKAILQAPLRLITEAPAGEASPQPWTAPNDYLDVFGGRWVLEHLALPLLASAYTAIAVGVVYNLLLKTLWDIWDRRTKFRPAATAGG